MSIVFLIYSLLALAAMASDIVYYKIPNAIVLALLLVFVVVAFAYMPHGEWSGHALAGAGTLLVAVLLYVGRALGAGDAKMMSALAVWAGLDGLFPLLFYVSVIAFLGMLVILILRRALPLAMKRGWMKQRDLPRVLRKGEGVPYAIGIGPGAILATTWFPAWLWQM